MVTTRAHSSSSSELTHQQQQQQDSIGEQESRDSLSELSSTADSSPLPPPPKQKARTSKQKSLFTAIIDASSNAIPPLLQKITFIDFYELIFNLSGINPPEISSFDEIRDVLNTELTCNNFTINKQIRLKFDIILKKLPKINTKIINDCVNFGILLSDVKYRQLRLFGVLIACYLQSPSYERILNAVLIPRSKDIYDEIRFEIIKYLKISNNYENIIISNALFDKSEKIRAESVEIYKNSDKLFRRRFSRRIVEMALFDTSEKVRQIALKEARRLLEEQLVEDERDKVRLAIEFGINVDNYEEFKKKVKEICDLFNCKIDEIVYKLASNVDIDILMQFDELTRMNCWNVREL